MHCNPGFDGGSARLALVLADPGHDGGIAAGNGLIESGTGQAGNLSRVIAGYQEGGVNQTRDTTPLGGNLGGDG